MSKYKTTQTIIVIIIRLVMKKVQPSNEAEEFLNVADLVIDLVFDAYFEICVKSCIDFLKMKKSRSSVRKKEKDQSQR